LGYEKASLLDWPINIVRWLDVALIPFLGGPVDPPPLLDHFVTRIAQWYAIPAAAILLALFFAIFRWNTQARCLCYVSRMLPLFALAMALVGMIPYFALPDGYAGSRYHYAASLGEAMLLAALGRELLHLAEGKKTGRAAGPLRMGLAVVGGLWMVVSFVQLGSSTLHDREANRVPRELYDFFASQTDKADRPVMFVVDTEWVRPFVDAQLGWGLLECARLALDSDNVAAVELGFDLEDHMLIEFNGHQEWYLVQREDAGWSASRMPDHSRLKFTTTPEGQRVVACDKQF
jgi:hypothetical protein